MHSTRMQQEAFLVITEVELLKQVGKKEEREMKM